MGLTLRARATRGTESRRADRIGPGDDLELAVLVLDQRGAALHPVAAVHIADALIVANDGHSGYGRRSRHRRRDGAPRPASVFSNAPI